MCAQFIVCKVPSSFHEIKYRDDRKQWEQAIKKEINLLLRNNTWTLMSKPVNKILLIVDEYSLLKKMNLKIQ